jgi:phosphopantothenoylcysteine decarboxylase/phosphopantothenate--cysteine ligase
MGYAVAAAAQARGAEVTLVTGPTALTPPPAVDVVAVTTAEEMTKALWSRLPWATVLIMAAAVADYRPAHTAAHKIKKSRPGGRTLQLEHTTDILTALSAHRTNQLFVGFAAETQDIVAHARHKLTAKNLDFIVANDVTKAKAGFGSDQNAATVIARDGQIAEFPLMSKRRLADEILSLVHPALRRRSRGARPSG